MSYLSYNTNTSRQTQLRHIFWPNKYGLLCETIIAILALIIFNATQLSNQFLTQGVNLGNPTLLLLHPLRQLLSRLDSYSLFQDVFLFGLWAIAGVLIYLLIYRLLRSFFEVEHFVDSGIQLVRQDITHGLGRWFASLHDFFVKLLLTLAGSIIIFVGSFVCFGIASQELNNGLTQAFPASLGHLAVSLLAAVLSLRIIVAGATLLSSRFRDWYTTI